MSKVERTREIHDFLKEEGYDPTINEDGNVIFAVEGKLFTAILADEDPTFFSLACIGFWPIESPEERVQVERASLKVASDVPVAKVYPTDDNVCGTIEIFSSSLENLKIIFSRLVVTLDTAVERFAMEVQFGQDDDSIFGAMRALLDKQD